MSRWSTQLLPNPPKKKLANGLVRSPDSAAPPEALNHSDEWSSGSKNPFAASRLTRGNTVPLTALPRRLTPHVVPSSSSTAPSERRSEV